MKLKKLLSGVTAAIMALSSVAVASFTSASAADDYFAKIIFKNYGENSIPLVQGTADSEMAGATKIKVTFDMGPNAAYNQLTSVFISGIVGEDQIQTSFTGEGWPANGTKGYSGVIELDEAMAEGTPYIFKANSDNWEACTTEDNFVFGFTKVEFLDDTNSVLKTQTELGEAPVIKIPDPTNPDPTPVDPSKSVTARLYYADSDWAVQPNDLYDEDGNKLMKTDKPNEPMTGVDQTITGDGEYTFDITSKVTDYWHGDANGAIVFVIDFLDALKSHPNMKAELLSITLPEYTFTPNPDDPENPIATATGKTIELPFEAAKVLYGNIETDKQNLRLEIYNEYGKTKANPPIDITQLYLKFGDTMSVKIKVSGYADQTPSNPSVNTPSNNNTTKTPAKTTKTPAATRDPKKVAADKKAAQKAMKQAKLTSLKVKSKAKKKINVTWKKVKKAKGYQVQVSTKKNFKKVIFKKDLKKTKLNIKNKKIKSKKTYYVRVRAYATYKNANNKTVKVFSKWNKKLRKVKVK